GGGVAHPTGLHQRAHFLTRRGLNRVHLCLLRVRERDAAEHHLVLSLHIVARSTRATLRGRRNRCHYEHQRHQHSNRPHCSSTSWPAWSDCSTPYKRTASRPR